MSQENEYLRGLQEVRVSKDALLTVIKDNRVKHVEQYDEANAGWKLEIVKQLENDVTQAKRDYRKMLKQHKKNIADAENRLNRARGGDFRTDSNVFRTAKPTHHIDDYNGAIKKLELSLDDELELDTDDFNKFVMDQWTWKKDFTRTWEMCSGTLYNPANSIYYNASPSLFTTGSLVGTLTSNSWSTDKIIL